MPMEIERKFLVSSQAWRALVFRSERMRQGYLNRESQCSLRVRVSGEKAWLNIKGVTIGAQRLEFEYEIPLEDAEHMLDALSHKPLIEKRRHYVKVGSHCWEIDEFDGENSGLIVAEIELERVDEAFEHPEWLGQEVTEDIRYYNTSLSRTPYRAW
jgi:adenylate cyclase